MADSNNSNSRTPWTRAQDNCLRRLARLGASRHAIASILDRSCEAAVSRAKKLHIALPRNNYGPWRGWTQTEDDCIRQMAAAGIAANIIGSKIDRSGSAVYRRALIIGVRLAGRHSVLAYWDPQRLAQAGQWWLQNKTAGWIAKQLGQGVTKNSVIGKMYRLGYQRAHPPGKTEAAAKANRKRRAKRRPINYRIEQAGPQTPPQPLPSPLRVDIARVRHADLEPHHCRWPVGDTRKAGVGQPLFCGARRVPGMPYCSAHLARAYTRLPASELRFVEVPENGARCVNPRARQTSAKGDIHHA